VMVGLLGWKQKGRVEVRLAHILVGGFPISVTLKCGQVPIEGSPSQGITFPLAFFSLSLMYKVPSGS
jgi:hypothetical protein